MDLLTGLRALIIKHESKPLREDLSAMNTILQDYIDKSDNMGVIGRVRYAVLDRNKLQSITASLMRSRTNFGSMLDLINLKAHEQHARSDLASQAMLKAILDRQIQEGEARKAEARARGEKNDGKLEEILQILKERHPAPSKVSSEKLSQSQFLSQIETELQKLGLTKTKAKAVRHDVAKALSESEPPVPMPTLLYPKEEPREKRRISDPFPQTNPEMHRSHSAQNGVSHVTNLGSTPKKTGVCRILCVDSTHGSKYMQCQDKHSMLLTSISPRHPCTYLFRTPENLDSKPHRALALQASALSWQHHQDEH